MLKAMGEKFLRCHHCWLVNFNKVDSCYKKKRLLIIDKFGIQVSARKWKDVIWKIEDNNIKP
jgi:DNA-binding LytR/AlgR family response regulator